MTAGSFIVRCSQITDWFCFSYNEWDNVMNKVLNSFSHGGMESPKMLAGKLKLSTVLPEFIEGVADIRMHGDDKYGVDSWKNVTREAWIDGMFRHLLELMKGNKINDKDWCHHHALHIATSAMFVNWLDSQQEEEPEIVQGETMRKWDGLEFVELKLVDRDRRSGPCSQCYFRDWSHDTKECSEAHGCGDKVWVQL